MKVRLTNFQGVCVRMGGGELSQWQFPRRFFFYDRKLVAEEFYGDVLLRTNFPRIQIVILRQE